MQMCISSVCVCCVGTIVVSRLWSVIAHYAGRQPQHYNIIFVERSAIVHVDVRNRNGSDGTEWWWILSFFYFSCGSNKFTRDRMSCVKCAVIHSHRYCRSATQHYDTLYVLIWSVMLMRFDVSACDGEEEQNKNCFSSAHSSSRNIDAIIELHSDS